MLSIPARSLESLMLGDLCWVATGAIGLRGVAWRLAISPVHAGRRTFSKHVMALTDASCFAAGAGEGAVQEEGGCTGGPVHVAGPKPDTLSGSKACVQR